jgi:ribosomal protein S18 acetylase RimI-like enzyme
MTPPFRVEPLSETHNRSAFSCGQEPLDRYLKTQASQDLRRRMATCFLAIESATGEVAAYYTLAAAGIPLTDLPAEIVKKLPRYPSIPAVRIGRLAVDLRFQGRGLGSAMLADALQRVLAAPPAAFALLVDAKDDTAVNFYRRFGFIPLASQPRTLFLPVATALNTLP